MDAREFFSALWADYTRVTPQAARVFAYVEARYGNVTNDHVAFRTFDRPGVSLEEIEGAFLGFGYERHRPYSFPGKHLEAFGYVPPDASLPFVFASEIRTAALPESARLWIDRALSSVTLPRDPVDLLLAGRPWGMPTWEEYQMMNDASPYAAWLSVWGFRANHFTIALHHLESRPNLHDLVTDLRAHGFVMSEEGGLYKGSPDELLEQASTLAEMRPLVFSGGEEREVPSCYYEFARRHRQADGTFYPGFVAASANDIFESTTARKAVGQ